MICSTHRGFREGRYAEGVGSRGPRVPRVLHSTFEAGGTQVNRARSRIVGGAVLLLLVRAPRPRPSCRCSTTDAAGSATRRTGKHRASSSPRWTCASLRCASTVARRQASSHHAHRLDQARITHAPVHRGGLAHPRRRSLTLRMPFLLSGTRLSERQASFPDNYKFAVVGPLGSSDDLHAGVAWKRG